MVNGHGQRHVDGLNVKAKSLFDTSVERLDAHTRSRLRRARHRALQELEHRSFRLRFWRAPAGALAGAAVVMLIIGSWTDKLHPPVVPLEDLEIVADADNLELLQDVDFYAWLDEP